MTGQPTHAPVAANATRSTARFCFVVKSANEPLSAELTLVTPPFGCSTPAVYAAWDRLGGPTGDGPNDLEPAALAVEPRLARWRDELGDATGMTPVLAGSGSTWFVHGAHPGVGRTVVRCVPARWCAPGADA